MTELSQRKKAGCCSKHTLIDVNLNNASQLRLKSDDAFIVYTGQHEDLKFFTLGTSTSSHPTVTTERRRQWRSQVKNLRGQNARF